MNLVISIQTFQRSLHTPTFFLQSWPRPNYLLHTSDRSSDIFIFPPLDIPWTNDRKMLIVLGDYELGDIGNIKRNIFLYSCCVGRHVTWLQYTFCILSSIYASKWLSPKRNGRWNNSYEIKILVRGVTKYNHFTQIKRWYFSMNTSKRLSIIICSFLSVETNLHGNFFYP